MASASVFLSFHLLNPNHIHKSTNIPKSSRSKSLLLPPPIHSIPGEATSYTRLPPKHDFQPNPSPFHDVIKLRDAVVPPLDSSKPTNFKEPAAGDGEEELLAFDSDEEGDSDGGPNEEEDVKDKGVPAVMRCFDRAKIYVKSGDGGDGAVAFRREKYVPYGGPSGGDGGRGGDVYVEVDGSMNSLLSFRKNVHFRAGRGGHGLGKKQAGGKGEDVAVKVAPGTVVRECWKGGMEGGLLLEMLKPGERALLFPGGRGGRGNASFKSGTRKAPRIAENGEAGAEMLVCFCVLLLFHFLAAV